MHVYNKTFLQADTVHDVYVGDSLESQTAWMSDEILTNYVVTEIVKHKIIFIYAHIYNVCSWFLYNELSQINY